MGLPGRPVEKYFLAKRALSGKVVRALPGGGLTFAGRAGTGPASVVRLFRMRYLLYRPGRLLLPGLLLPGILLAGCGPRYSDLPAFSAERQLLQLVVETPAGTNHELHYNPATNAFVARQLAGLAVVVEFLPAPGNLGFVPGTAAPTASGPAATPLPALLLAESQPTGTILEVLPVALLTLDINGQLQPLVVAVPARPSQRILPRATSWASLNRYYPGVRPLLGQWFQHRAPNTRLVGWKDEKAAGQLIRQWLR